MDERTPDLISELGVSKKLGNSVLDELNNRTSTKLQQLKQEDDVSMNPLIEKAASHEFNLIFNDEHAKQFNTMDSIDTHFITTTPTKNMHVTEPLESSQVKRLKFDAMIQRTPPPVTDITRRIRRLRIRTSSHHSQELQDKQNKIRLKPLTDMTAMKPPSFLQPTINSMNKVKIKHSDSMKQGLDTQSSQIRRETKPKNTIQNRVKQSPSMPHIPKPTSSSGSVFDRLYKQNTMSRSSSVSSLLKKDGSMSRSGSMNIFPKTSKIQFGRSKTNVDLNVNETIENENRRPIWR